MTNISEEILKSIQNSKNILLHCHPYPDPDSVGSVLALSLYLKSLKKNFTAITGDSDLPKSLAKLPSLDIFTKKNFNEIEINNFDLFIILDSSSIHQITQLKEISFPKTLKTINIDHHITNNNYGDINLVKTDTSSTCEIVFELLKSWNADIDRDMAIALFVGLFADTGGFKYQNANFKILEIASELTKINPNFHEIIFEIENSKEQDEIRYMGLALNSLETFFENTVVISSVSFEDLKKANIKKEHTQCDVPTFLRSAVGWELAISMVEIEPNVVNVSIRNRDSEKFDASLIAKNIGNGGGHRAAAGTTVKKSLEETKKEILKIIPKVYENF